jgi:hypothetical protein
MGIVRYWGIAVASALAVAGSAPSVLAHAGDGGTDKVHACVHKSNGKMRVVGADPSTSCKGNENPLHFAIQGEAGPTGAPGTPGRVGRSALTALAPGETVSGVWGASVTAQSGGDSYRAFATFPVPLETDIPEGNQIYVAGESAPHCPGRGQADAGYLCVYQGYTENADTPNDGNIFDPSTFEGPPGSSRFGFGIYLESEFSGLSAVSGTFSVTPP